MNIRRFARLALIGLAAALQFGGGAAAQSFPSKPINFIVPYAPGGISDILGRAVSASLEEQFGQPVVVINKPSPGIVLGLTEIATAQPDGYTIGIWANSAITFPLVTGQSTPYDGVESFTFLRSYGSGVLGVVVGADSPFKTFKELLDAGKASPGKYKYGSVGVNSGQHRVLEAAAKVHGAKFIHIAQKGTAAGVANVLGGHLDFLSDASSWAPNVRQGQMRVLVLTGDKRNPYFPDVPIYKEFGVQEDYSGRLAVVGPAKLPPAIKDKLETALDKAFHSDKVKEAVANIGQPIESMPSDVMRQAAIDSRILWKKLLAE